MKGAGDKAFCAGGDVTGISDLLRKVVEHSVLATLPGDNMATLTARQNYFRHEYTLDYYLSTYDKPMVAIMDGITSIHHPINLPDEDSGWRRWLEYQLSLSNCDRKDFVRYARNINWILPRCRGDIFPPSSRRRIGHLPWSHGSSTQSLRYCVPPQSSLIFGSYVNGIDGQELRRIMSLVNDSLR